VHRRTLCPEFEEEFVFDVSPSELARRTLEIVVLDYDRYSQDEHVGQVNCPLDQLAALPPNERVTLWKGFTAYEKKREVLPLRIEPMLIVQCVHICTTYAVLNGFVQL